jgi:DNA-binding MarR family transcriptional regulator
MTGEHQRDELNADILVCFSELINKVMGHGEQLALRLGVPVPFIKALHILDRPMAMKDLGQKLHCDPSFVTLVADMLEKHGMARREPHSADRRIKNLVLTDDGLSLRRQIETEVAAWMPWNRTLNDDERLTLLALLRKMLSAKQDTDVAEAPAGAAATGAQATDEDSGPEWGEVDSAVSGAAVTG